MPLNDARRLLPGDDDRNQSPLRDNGFSAFSGRVVVPSSSEPFQKRGTPGNPSVDRLDDKISFFFPVNEFGFIDKHPGVAMSFRDPYIDVELEKSTARPAPAFQSETASHCFRTAS